MGRRAPPLRPWLLTAVSWLVGGCVLDWGLHPLLPPPAPQAASCPDASVRGCGLVAVAVADGGSTFQLGDTQPPWASVPIHNAQPPVQVRLDDGFRMDAYEVTVARFRAFWSAGHPAPAALVPYPGERTIVWEAGWQPREPTPTSVEHTCNWTSQPGVREAHPVNCVDWPTALAFCAWDHERLPTEAEREWAARYASLGQAPPPRDFPFGAGGVPAAPGDCTLLQWGACAGDDDLGGSGTRRVGSFAPLGGIYDLGGNVGEWLADVYRLYGDNVCWRPSAVTANPLCVRNDAQPNLRTARGGNFGISTIVDFDNSSRGGLDLATPDAKIGFRCVSGP